MEIVEKCAALAPDMHVRSAARSIIRDIESKDTAVTTADDAVVQVRAIVEKLAELILPEYQELLKQTDIYVVNQPLCNAHADFKTHSIVLFEGLFQVLTFRMELSLLIARVKKHLDFVEKAGITRANFPSIAYQAQTLSLHFLHNPQPLPKLDEHFDAQLKEDAVTAFCGGLLFILFHELGHLVLGHGSVNGDPTFEAGPSLACLEGINYRKKQEFEADAFAFDALVNKAKSMVIVNVWYVMNLFLDYESLAGAEMNTHPFSINRLSNLNRLSGALEDPTIAANVSRMYESRLKLMQTRLDAVHPDEHLLLAHDRLRINREAYLKVLGNVEDCRTALAKLVEAFVAVRPI